MQTATHPETLVSEMAKYPVALQTLVVAYDFSAASITALSYARAIAKTFDSEIILAHVDTPETVSDRMDAGSSKARAEQLAERADLERVTTRLESDGIKSSYVVQSGSASDLLVQLAAVRKPDLLLMGAYGYHASDRITLGSTAEYLLRSLKCPVLIVGPSVPSHPEGRVRVSRVLYASGLPEKQGRAQALVCELARKFAMHVHVVHAEQSESFAGGSGVRELEWKAEKIADYFRTPGVGASWVLRYGSQHDLILEQAKVTSADILCYGLVHPPTDPSQMGTLTSIIRAARCPILTVPGPA